MLASLFRTGVVGEHCGRGGAQLFFRILDSDSGHALHVPDLVMPQPSGSWEKMHLVTAMGQ